MNQYENEEKDEQHLNKYELFNIMYIYVKFLYTEIISLMTGNVKDNRFV